MTHTPYTSQSAGRCPPPQKKIKCPEGIWAHDLIHGSLGPPKSAPHMASWTQPKNEEKMTARGDGVSALRSAPFCLMTISTQCMYCMHNVVRYSTFTYAQKLTTGQFNLVHGTMKKHRKSQNKLQQKMTLSK